MGRIEYRLILRAREPTLCTRLSFNYEIPEIPYISQIVEIILGLLFVTFIDDRVIDVLEPENIELDSLIYV